MTELEKATAIISAALGVEAPEVAELLTSDDAVTQATGRLETKFTELRDQGDQRATKKTRTTVEKAFKDAGISDATFADLPAAIEALQSKAVTTGDKALTPEQVLKHPAAVAALNAERLKTETAVADAEKKVRGELETERQAFAKQRTDAAVRAAAEAEIAKLNPNFTPGKEAAQKERLIKELLTEGKFQLAENGEVQLVDEDGNVLPGKLGNGVAKFADLVRERAEDVYGLPVSTEKQSAGLTPEQIAAGQNATVFKEFKGAAPKTAEEYQELANDPNLSTPALQELQAYWKEKAA